MKNEPHCNCFCERAMHQGLDEALGDFDHEADLTVGPASGSLPVNPTTHRHLSATACDGSNADDQPDDRPPRA
jgi:hypothetical protein